MSNIDKVLVGENQNLKCLLEILNDTAFDWNNGINFDNNMIKFNIILETQEFNKNIEKILVELKIKFDIICN
ncbi:hypothetical protein D3C87_2038140 [compost metagenome]